MTKEEIFQKAIGKNGIEGQLHQLHEEIGELMQAINKVRRLKGIGINYIMPVTKHSSIKYALAYSNLCSEIADVSNILEQLRYMTNPEQVDLSKERALSKLEGQLAG